MSTATPNKLMTAEEFLSLPEKDNVTRELVDGVLVERPVTTRSPKHSTALTRIGQILLNWLDAQPETEGVVAGGEARCRLAENPDLIVGIDVAYFQGAEAVRQSEEEPFFEGPPVVAVEVLSPSDTHEEISEKIKRYLGHGVKQVWIADPDFQTITVHRSDDNPVFYNSKQTVDGGPELEGFHVRAGMFFSAKQTDTN